MAWNEPGGGNRDPWNSGSGSGGGDKGPPDLDEVVRKLQERLGGLFGGKQGSSGSGGGGGGLGRGGTLGIGLLLVVGLVVWLVSGFYVIEPAERGVVLRFGAYKDTTEPGLHWHIPVPVEKVNKVNVDAVSTFGHKASMLTRDENIVDIELTVQSRIQDAYDYLFQDSLPMETLRDATETAVREVIGKSDLDFVLTEGRGAIATDVQTLVQQLVDQYKTGLKVTYVNMLPAKPPEQVKSAFDDAIKAREDKERIENEAQAYANEVVPVARGAAAREVENAKAHKARVVAEATGESQRFTALLAEYQKAPGVTRQRLYLETVEEVYGNTNKVLLDAEDNNNLTYLPLDKIVQQQSSLRQSPTMQSGSMPSATLPQQMPQDLGAPTREVDRTRRAR